MKYSILVTSIGSYSAECTIDSLRDHFSGAFYGCDIHPAGWHSVSSKFDMVFRSPLVKDEDNYDKFIQNLCSQYDIDMIIPLTDVDVDFFNRRRQRFKDIGVQVTLANETFISVARDKRELNQYIIRQNFDSIKTFTFEELTDAPYPLIAKPADGRSSEGIHLLDTKKALRPGFDYSHYVFQEIMEGDVCCVDYVRDSISNRSFYLPRIELLRTKHGAGTTVKTIKSKKIGKIVESIGQDLDIHGCINMEFIINGNKLYLMDINPRFSAGIGFSKLAGYDFVKNHVYAFTGTDIETDTPYSSIIAQKKIVDVVNKRLD